MKKIILTLMTAAVMVSCAEDQAAQEEAVAQDEQVTKETENAASGSLDVNSAEYKLAAILCECFESFNPGDSQGQMDAVGCMMQKIGDSKELQNTDEAKTKAILAELCPETAQKFETWTENMKKN